MKPEYLPTGSIIQLDPRADSAFAGCLFFVVKSKPTKIEAGMVMPKAGPSGNPVIYLGLPYKDIEHVGTATWPLGDLRDANLSEQQQFDLTQQQLAKLEKES